MSGTPVYFLPSAKVLLLIDNLPYVDNVVASDDGDGLSKSFIVTLSLLNEKRQLHISPSAKKPGWSTLAVFLGGPDNLSALIESMVLVVGGTRNPGGMVGDVFILNESNASLAVTKMLTSSIPLLLIGPSGLLNYKSIPSGISKAKRMIPCIILSIRWNIDDKVFISYSVLDRQKLGRPDSSCNSMLRVLMQECHGSPIYSIGTRSLWLGQKF